MFERPHHRSILLALALGLGLASGSGCRRGQDESAGAEGGPSPEASASAAALGQALPPLELTAETEHLLLTWVDEAGDFHVVEKVSEVPEDRRAKVRVVVTDQPPLESRWVYVADLQKPGPTGKYTVQSMPRAAWDAIGAERRKERMEALAPKPGDDDSKPAAAVEVSAIIYGADWCKPCHQAEDFLKKLGVKVDKKNIEKDPVAAQAMREKLKKVGQPGASIPVIDIAGQVVVGFSAKVLERLVDHARGKKP
jgi:glutaredoxin